MPMASFSSAVHSTWLVVAGGILIQLCLGALYAWSAFTARLAGEPYGLTAVRSQWIFSLALVSFAVVMALVAGRWPLDPFPGLGGCFMPGRP